MLELVRVRAIAGNALQEVCVCVSACGWGSVLPLLFGFHEIVVVVVVVVCFFVLLLVAPGCAYVDVRKSKDHVSLGMLTIR